MLISKAFEQLIDYIDDIQTDNLYTAGVQSYASYNLYHDEKFLNKNNPYTIFLMANDYPKAYLMLETKQDVVAYQYLGLCKYRGLGTNRSIEEARKFFEMAISLGSIPAKTYLAQTYLDEEKFKEGFILLKKSEDFVLSSFYLGNCYFNGYGVEEDKDRAERYYHQAMKYGYDEAAYTLGMHFLASDKLDYGIKSSFRLLDQAASKGHERALLFLIQYFYNRDDEKYLDYLVKAALVGNSDVKYHLGYDYLMGINLPKDKSKAYYWLSFAAKENHEQAIKILNDSFCPIEI